MTIFSANFHFRVNYSFNTLNMFLQFVWKAITRLNIKLVNIEERPLNYKPISDGTFNISHGTLINGSGRGLDGEELFNTICILVFFAQKLYSPSFITLRLSHWCHMDYFNDVLTTFLGREHVKLCCCLCRVRKLSDFIKKVLICILKMNEGLTGLEQHEGE